MKQKRIVERPWGRRRNGGWVIKLNDLIEALKKGEAVELDKVAVGTKILTQLLKLLPGEYCQISVNGSFEVETLQFVPRKQKDGKFRAGFSKPKHYCHSFRLFDGAWLKPAMLLKVVVLKPRKF